MRPSEIELWVHRVVPVVESGGRIEDSRVELKSVWPTPEKAARLVAGHANASQGDSILWIVGVDEDSGRILGAGDNEFSNWHKAFVAAFDEPAPHCTDVVVPYNDKHLVGLHFETDRPPYVIKTSGQISREVPFRVGTHVNSANRMQILRVLAPLAEKREVETVWGRLMFNPDARSMGAIKAHRCHMRFQAAIMLLQGPNTQTYLTSHRSKATLRLNNGVVIELPLGFFPDGFRNEPTLPTLSIVGPQMFGVLCEVSLESDAPIPPLNDGDAQLEIVFNPPNVNDTLTVLFQMAILAKQSTDVARNWAVLNGIATRTDNFRNNILDVSDWLKQE